MSGKALKSQISDTMLNGEQLAADTDNSNFADFKPERPVAYKIEFKKSRDSLKMIGEVFISFFIYCILYSISIELIVESV